MKKFILAFFVLSANFNFGQSITVDWVDQMEGYSIDFGYSIAVDNIGNVYITGSFLDSVDFDPGPGTYFLNSSGMNDIYVLKLDPSGNFIWARAMGGPGGDVGHSIAVDASGNVYTAGWFQDTADFDPGTSAYNLVWNGYTDGFVSKLDAAGNFAWAKPIGGGGTDYARQVRVDGTGNSYITGSFQATVDFDPGTGVNYISSTGMSDGFLLKLDAAGNMVYAKTISGPSYDEGYGLTVNASQEVFLCGYFDDSADFDPGAGVYSMISAGSNEAFAIKLDAGGNLVWAKQFGGIYSESANSITLDPSGNVLIGGVFWGTADFDPGSGIFPLTSFGDQDNFIVKLNPSGNFIWAAQLGGANFERVQTVCTDGAGNVYASGDFSHASDFDPSSSTYTMTSIAGTGDMYVCKLDAAGNFEWAKQMGGNQADIIWDMHVSAAGTIYLTGNFETTVDFDPETGVNNYTCVSGLYPDIFVTKWEDGKPGGGLSPATQKPAYAVFPNPFNNDFSIETTSGFTNEHICVYTLAGQKIPFTYTFEQNRIIVKPVCKNGIYLVKIENGQGEQIVLKLVKN